jgi:quinol monooxygenase YgiN
MPIIVAGKLTIKPNFRDEFVKKSCEAVLLARKDVTCEDFSVSADPVDLNRVNIFEKWPCRSALEDFRGEGQGSDLFSLIESFDVHEYELA